jgi:hypothetical protein
MARAEDELSEDELEELEDEREDLKSALTRARKKPRYFAIIAKGPEVLSLMVQKKPFRESVLRYERREEGGKQIIEGVCQGERGSDLVFKVEGGLPKIKKSSLRKFISDETGLMLKPRFISDAAGDSAKLAQAKSAKPKS